MNYVIFLRGVNVSGKNKLNMKDFKNQLSSHFKNVSTYIQSGNIIIESDLSKSKINEIFLETLNHFSISCPLFILDQKEFELLINNNSFINESIDKLHVSIIDNEINENQIVELNSISEDQISIYKSFLYILCHNGYGNTKLNNNFIERKLKINSTTRNWKTILALKQMLK
jgi:uncharacterized protein (DUF1697 family)